jgi:hypothetical protein
MEIAFLRKEHVIPSDLEFLTLLALWGPMDLTAFCEKAANHIYTDVDPYDLPKRSQNVRNRVVKLEKRGLMIKQKKGKKQVMVTPELIRSDSGAILLDYQFLSVEP